MVFTPYTLLFGFLCLWGTLAMGQNTKNPQGDYINGLTMLRQDKPDLALDLLRPLTDGNKHPSFAANAQYGCALAYYKKSDFPNALLFLQELRKMTDSPDLLEEAEYLELLIALGRKQYLKAIRGFSKLSGSSLLGEDAQKAMEDAYLHQIPKDSLMDWAKKGSQKAATYLVYRELDKPETEQDKPLLQDLAEQYKEIQKLIISQQKETSHASLSSFRPSLRKDRYHVSILLPLKLELLDPSRSNRVSQFALDYLAGLQMGLAEVNEQDTLIHPHFFDTEQEPKTIQGILGEGRLDLSDAVVGPVFSEIAEPVVSYCSEKGIPVLQPFTRKRSLLDSGATLLQMTPDYKNVGEAILNFALDSLKKTKCLLLYDTYEQDTLLAQHFRQLAASKGVELVLDKAMTASKSYKLRDWYKDKVLDRDTAAADYFVVSFVSVPSIAVNIVTALEFYQSNPPLFADFDWIENKRISLKQIFRQNLIFYHFFQTNTGDKRLTKFDSLYYKKVQRVPSKFSYQGYETALFLAETFRKHGAYFDIDLQYEDEPYLGKISRGYHYCSDRVNTFVPFSSIGEDRITLEPANSILYEFKDYKPPEQEE